MRALESQALAKSVFILSAQSSDVPVPNQDKDLSLPALPEDIEALFPCTVFFRMPFVRELRKQFRHLFSARSPVSYFIILTATAQSGL